MLLKGPTIILETNYIVSLLLRNRNFTDIVIRMKRQKSPRRLSHLTRGPGIQERFEQEAATVRGMTNPHIVRLLDHGRDAQNVPFIVMEWVEGETLRQRLDRSATDQTRFDR